MVSLEVFIDIIFLAAIWPWGTQPLTEMSTRNICWGINVASAYRLTTLPPSQAYCHEIWEPQSPGTLRACPALNRDCFTFLLFM